MDRSGFISQAELRIALHKLGVDMTARVPARAAGAADAAIGYQNFALPSVTFKGGDDAAFTGLAGHYYANGSAAAGGAGAKAGGVGSPGGFGSAAAVATAALVTSRRAARRAAAAAAAASAASRASTVEA